MGILSNLRRGSTAAQEDRRASITDYSASLDDRLQDDLDEKQRTAVQNEKNNFDNMSDKEKMRWIEFKKRGNFGKDQGAAGAYAGGKCC